jgi:hypothetical protein
MTNIEALEAAIVAEARPGKMPGDLLSAVKRKFPDASNQMIVRAAFHVMMDLADDSDFDRARAVQDFAIKTRNNDH